MNEEQLRIKAGGETCPNCMGTGQESSWNGVYFGQSFCFWCDGTGIYLTPGQEMNLYKHKNK